MEALADCIFNQSVQCAVSNSQPSAPNMAVSDVTGMLVILHRRAGKEQRVLDSLNAALWASLLYSMDMCVADDQQEVCNLGWR